MKIKKQLLFLTLLSLVFLITPVNKAKAGQFGCVKDESCKTVTADTGEKAFDQCEVFCGSNFTTCYSVLGACPPKAKQWGCNKLGECSNITAVYKYTAIKSCGQDVEEGPCDPALSGTSKADLKIQARSVLNKANFSSPTDIINRAIRLLTAFIGSISLVLYIYAGFLWMTASGNTEQVGKAKTTMVWTTLGVAMMLLSYMLASSLFKSISGVSITGSSSNSATHTPGTKCDPNGDFNKVWGSDGTTCTTKCEYTYPGNGQCMDKSACAAPKTTQQFLCPGADPDFLCCKS
jgi:hypothetical protein